MVVWRGVHGGCGVGLCDMDKKYISRFFDFFFRFRF